MDLPQHHPADLQGLPVQPGRPVEATQLVVQPGQVVQKDRHRRVRVMSSIQQCIIAIGTRRSASHSPSPAARSSCRAWTSPAADEAWAPPRGASPGPSCHNFTLQQNNTRGGSQSQRLDAHCP